MLNHSPFLFHKEMLSPFVPKLAQLDFLMFGGGLATENWFSVIRKTLDVNDN